MASFIFYVYGEPKGQPRPRAFARKIGDKHVARVYDAGTAEGWKSLIALHAKKTGIVGAMLKGPIELMMACKFTRPKSHFRTGRNQHLLKDPAQGNFHVAKPDMDNIVKAAKDCLTQLGAWHDDSQVCVEKLTKRWAEYGQASGTYFSIRQIEDKE